MMWTEHDRGKAGSKKLQIKIFGRSKTEVYIILI